MSEVPGYKSSMGYRETVIFYNDYLKDGWKFKFNTPDSHVDEFAGHLESRGHEVRVGTTAFFSNGEKNAKARVIFSKN